MKKTFAIGICAVMTIMSLSVTAFAANFNGNIWTNKPNVLGLGYYCTAAQCLSGGDTSTHYARAYSYDSAGRTIASGTATGNNQAVANSGSTKPYSGYGCYGESGTSLFAEASFTSGAWD